MWRRKRNPPLPQNVRLLLADGRVVPIELVYSGYHDGMHVWTSAHVVYIDEPQHATVACDVLPATTRLDLDIRVRGEL